MIAVTFTNMTVLCKYAATKSLNITYSFVSLDPPIQPYIRQTNTNNTKPLGGPYQNNETLDLSCLNMGGFPQPTLQWYIDSGPVGEDVTVLVHSQDKTQLRIEQLSHTRHHDMQVTCRAETATTTIQKTIQIRVKGRTRRDY